jgi:hypothetical protein
MKTKTNFEIKQVLNQPYKYGFQTKIETEKFLELMKKLSN